MTELLWQAWLLLAVAFFVGAVLACSLKRRFYYKAAAKSSDVAVSGLAHAPAPTEPKIEVAPRTGVVEGERFNRAISGQSPLAPAAAVATAAVAAAPAAAAVAPVVVAAPKAAAPAAPVGDDLTRIRAIDTKIRSLLNGAGISKFSDLAALSPSATALQ